MQESCYVRGTETAQRASPHPLNRVSSTSFLTRFRGFALSGLLTTACGPVAPPAAPSLPHRVFGSSGEALKAILAEHPKVRVIGVGEFHAKTDGPPVRSTLSRLTDDMLVELGSWGSDLVLETWVVQGDCAVGHEVAAQVAKETRRPEATESELQRAARVARQRGMTPHVLGMTCDEQSQLRGEDGQLQYGLLLELLTRKLEAQALAARARPDVRLVLYGGAVHNDLQPRPDLASYSYTRALQDDEGLFLELDLYVPELVRGQSSLSDEPWLPLLDDAVAPGRVVLYERGPRSLVLLLQPGVTRGDREGVTGVVP